MFWIILWLILSGTLLYFLGWTLYILFRQKTAWQKFAAQKKLRFRSKSLLSPPEMNGTINNRTFSFFIAEHLLPDARSTRKLSAVETQLSSRMPFEGAIASGGMVPLVQNLRFKEETHPDHPKWNKNYIAAAASRTALEAYMTPERIEALTSLMKIRNGWVILIFRNDMMLLRFDTPDPLDNVEKLNKITQKMLDLADVLELRKGEDGILKAEAAKAPAKEKSIPVNERDFEAQNLQLEEEQAESPKE